MRRQLKLQEQVHTDHIQEALAIKAQEADRKLKCALSEQSESDSLKYKTHLAAIVGRLRGLEAALKGECFLIAPLLLGHPRENVLTRASSRLSHFISPINRSWNGNITILIPDIFIILKNFIMFETIVSAMNDR